jgi:hypothetical protein
VARRGAAVHNFGVRSGQSVRPSTQSHSLILNFAPRVCGRSKPWPRSWRQCGHIRRQAPAGSCAIYCRAWLPLSLAAFAHGPDKASHFRRRNPSCNLSRRTRRVPPRETKRARRVIGNADPRGNPSRVRERGRKRGRAATEWAGHFLRC